MDKRRVRGTYEENRNKAIELLIIGNDSITKLPNHQTLIEKNLSLLEVIVGVRHRQ
jgi:hypothetical protein